MTRSEAAPRRPRDVRLDFFRGIGMFIIFISHMKGNYWSTWIPARFGFSDATEIFVFCSGMASAIAFGRVYDQRGFLLGTARVSYRCWQIYWTHIAAFFGMFAMLIVIDDTLRVGTQYVGQLNLLQFANRGMYDNIIGIMTLTYVPNFFDILPMYFVILLLMPVMMAASYVSRWCVIALAIALWVIVQFRLVEFPAEPWSDRVWFFNPLAWQLVFFTGFALIRGWLPAPPITRWGVGIAAAIVLISLPLAYWPFFRTLDVPPEWRQLLQFHMNKTHFGILRYVHFLALAYLAYAAAGEGGRRLSEGWFTEICRKVGQQALATFLMGQVLSILGGVALDLVGRTNLTTAIVNLTGCAILVATAYVVGWFKSQPWRGPTPTLAGAAVSGPRLPLEEPRRTAI